MDPKFIVSLGVALMLQLAGIVFWASNLQSAVQHNKYVNQMLQRDMEHALDFVTRWPRGELGSLPDDAEQNQRLTVLEKQMDKVVIKLWNGD